LRKIKKNKDKAILVDRFVIDFLADQTVNFGDLSDTCIFRKLIKFCDSFDAVFFISVKPEVALSRKNDIPGLDYLNDRDKAYRDIIKRLKRGFIIDNNGTRDSAVREILKVANI
jgi:thymidylate kinase